LSSQDIEERKLALDAEIRRREVALKESKAQKSRLTTAQATIGGALFTLLGGVIGAYIAAKSSENVATKSGTTAVDVEKIKVEGDLDLEKTKQTAAAALANRTFESNLIFEAIKTPSREDAVRNLRFFASVGFLPDYEAKITKLPDFDLPSLSSPSPSSLSNAINATGILSLVQGAAEPYTCTAAAITPRQALTRSECAGIPLGQDSILTLTLGEKLYRVKLIARDSKNEVALLQIDTANQDKGDSFGYHVDRTLIRDPISGERIYFAHTGAGTRALETTVCNVIENPPIEDWFTNNCAGGPGSAGAMVIAVSDNALLGIHFQKPVAGQTGRAIKLKRAMSELQSQLEP
jgi:hypothetical protein